MKEKVALVTGAHGIIGRYVASILAADGWNVTGIGHGNWSISEQTAWGVSSWHESDVSLSALRTLKVRPALIVHCAGSGAVGASITAPYSDFQRTVETTATILEFLRFDCPDAALVYPSSAAVYGVADFLPMTESMPLRPASPYGVHKKIAEELIREYARLFGLRTAIVRLFSIYGEGFRKQLLWDACRKISSNQYDFFGTGDETRDWLHASDAAELLMQAGAYASSDCPIVNGGFGESVSVRDVLSELFRLLGRDNLPSFCGTERPGDPLHYHADMRRPRAWGWRPKTNWQVGLARYVSWFKNENGGA